MKLQRRTLLRGMFQGSTAMMAVPFLDCFLDSKGQALAAFVTLRTGPKISVCDSSLIVVGRSRTVAPTKFPFS